MTPSATTGEDGVGELRRLPSVERLAAAIDATGVVIHTNLGRAPLAVNNNAAAVMLALAALAGDGEVLVSRGELVEIGGSFRIPEILAHSGATLVEVGTTNRTRREDYERAIGPRTTAILRVHRSNFEIVGFTEQPQLAELATLAAERGIALVDDLGSGALEEVHEEPTVRRSLRAGADLVCCSGDKLLGGPQAGLLFGGADAVGRCRRDPLPGRCGSTSCRPRRWRRRCACIATPGAARCRCGR